MTTSAIAQLLRNGRTPLVLVAAITAGAAATYLRFGVSGEAAAGAIFLAIVAVLAVINHRTHIYPNRIVVPAYAIVLALTCAGRGATHRLPIHLAAGLAFGGALLLLALWRPGAIGMGDVKVAALIGFAVGYSVGLAAAGAIAMGALLVLQGSQQHPDNWQNHRVASWPILVVAAVPAFLLGGW